MRHFLIAVLVVLLPISATAHSKVNTTDPADGAVIAAAPDNIAFTFAKGLRMTKAVLRSDAGEMDLKLPKQNGFGTDLSVPLALPGPGEYQVEWRGLSVDGHAVTGTVSFTLE